MEGGGGVGGEDEREMDGGWEGGGVGRLKRS